MARWKRLFYLLLINVICSASTTFAVLYFWDQAKTAQSQPQVLLTTPDIPIKTQIIVVTELVTPTTIGLVGLPTEATIAPSKQTESYRVRAGDTLGVIAQRYGLSVADILAVNDISNPDALYVDQLLYLPTNPLPANTPTPTTPAPTETPTSTPRLSPTPSHTPTATPNMAEPLLIIESAVGAGDATLERVRVKHLSGREVSLAGWRLSDEDGNVYVFPQLSLLEGSSVSIHTTTGLDSVTDLYWGLSFSIWKPGEKISLNDSQGNLIAEFVAP